MRRSATKRRFQAGMLRDQLGHARPRRDRDRVQRFDQAGAKHRPSAVALPTRPAERIKLRDQRRYFGRVQNGRDFGCDRPPSRARLMLQSVITGSARCCMRSRPLTAPSGADRRDVGLPRWVPALGAMEDSPAPPAVRRSHHGARTSNLS
jgi:hypothetical protein